MNLRARAATAGSTATARHFNPLFTFRRFSAATVVTGWLAVVVVVLLVSELAEMNFGTATLRRLDTGTGEQLAAQLADGSLVTLNAQTRLGIARSFTRGERNVSLQGEAHFTVEANEGRTFTVTAELATVKVLGTEFAVKAYAGEPVRVVVAEGTVTLSNGGGQARDIVALSAGDLGLVESSGEISVEHVGVVDRYLGWMDSRLLFEDSPLSSVASELERWYGIRVRVVDPELGSRRLTAEFQQEPFDEVLDIIAISLGARYDRKELAVTFLPKD